MRIMSLWEIEVEYDDLGAIARWEADRRKDPELHLIKPLVPSHDKFPARFSRLVRVAVSETDGTLSAESARRLAIEAVVGCLVPELERVQEVESDGLRRMLELRPTIEKDRQLGPIYVEEESHSRPPSYDLKE